MRNPKENSFPEVLDQYLEKYFGQYNRDSLPADLYSKMVGALEKSLFIQVLRVAKGNQVQAAKLLGINRNTLHTKLEKLNIKAKNK